MCGMLYKYISLVLLSPKFLKYLQNKFDWDIVLVSTQIISDCQLLRAVLSSNEVDLLRYST